jgi:hypothetical protein
MGAKKTLDNPLRRSVSDAQLNAKFQIDDFCLAITDLKAQERRQAIEISSTSD